MQFLHNGRFSVQTVFITHESLGGDAKMSATLPLLKIIEVHAVENLQDCTK